MVGVAFPKMAHLEANRLLRKSRRRAKSSSGRSSCLARCRSHRNARTANERKRVSAQKCMTSTYETVKSVWWLIHKDLIREVRARAMWPAMLMLGLLLVSILAMHIDLPKEQKEHLIGGLLWLAIVFAGTLALEWSFANEREDGCWKTLTLYP